MFFINEDLYTNADLEKQYEQLDNLQIFQDCNKKRIAVCTSDLFEYLAICLYIRKKGGSLVPIHAATPRDAAIRLAHNCSCHILIYGTLRTPILLINDIEEKQGVLVQMSSGTTGDPKCLERPWEDIQLEMDAYNISLPVEKDTVALISCPITHSYGLISGVLSALERNNIPIILSNLNPRYVLKKLVENPNHLLYAAPAYLNILYKLSHPTFSFHYIMTSGTLISAKWLDEIAQKSKRVLQQYGCSETGCIAINPEVHSPEVMGFVLPHIQVKAGNDRNQPEEIIISGKQGGIHTKDFGYFNEVGSLCLLGRIDDMINVAGLNVYPQEIEEVILKSPEIQEVIAYKKPDEYAGERVCVQYVASAFIEESRLREWCVKQLAPHQIPVEFIQVEFIPKLPNGKISRKLVGEVSG
ncbi:AMP-binding protein [Sutcliffiella horikoshii]|uniref:AMP-binding protein n=1 Tax=Sutcliffiella horikoshii TaxID=79883 RepID=UPI00204163B6|nr:AMP-binding protein [Sutcliffiella horikoshii]MCM3616042.1 AMP-binding protein [Sutcliffiella horikoshii]